MVFRVASSSTTAFNRPASDQTIAVSINLPGSGGAAQA
jgi:hypothetical protein